MRSVLSKISLVALLAFASASVVTAQNVRTAELKAEIDAFMAKEIAAHFADIKTLSPPPDRVFNALTVGEFSWGSFARSLAAQADIGGNKTIAGKDSARAIAEMGLYESRQGGKAFSQLYSTLALRHFGTDLSKNAVWQSMNDAERRDWEKLLDPTRFYDPVKRAAINLPENYLGVAARVAAMSYQMGVLKDRAFLDSLVERAAQQFTSGHIYSDDNPPTGRYDRYSNEYARFCWDAADIAGRKDIKEKLAPSIKQQMKLWWDVVSPAGYGYNWGRSQGLVSYLDTMEIVAFLADNPEFRPAPLPDLAALYYLSWKWMRADYKDDRHVFDVFAYGRGNYSYINPNREWQQTGTAFGKIILANYVFSRAVAKEGLTEFPASPKLPDVARFEFFARSPDKELGVWLVRQGKVRFALPITVGTKPGVADYLPAPYGLAGFAAPVEEVYPALTPFLTLSDGHVYSASDGADAITPGADGMSLRTVNRKWARVGSKSGERFENGLTSTVEWRLEGNKLTRVETVIAKADTTISKWRVAFPSTASSTVESDSNGVHSFDLTGRDGETRVSFAMFDGAKFSIDAPGDSRLGKGVLGAIPLHISAQASDIHLKQGEKIVWKLTIEVR